MSDGVQAAGVLEALKGVVDPEFGKDLVALGMAKQVTVTDGRVAFTPSRQTPSPATVGSSWLPNHRAYGPYGSARRMGRLKSGKSWLPGITSMPARGSTPDAAHSWFKNRCAAAN